MPKAIQNFLVHLFYLIQIVNPWEHVQRLIPGRNCLILLLKLSMSLSTLKFQWIFLMVQVKKVRDYFHFYEQMDYDDDTSSTMGVEDLTYSTLFNDEVVDNGERHAGLKPCDTGLETCDELKPTRHGNELLDNSIQSAVTKESSGIDNIAYLSGDDTGGTGHTQVYESRENMLDSKSISENRS